MQLANPLVYLMLIAFTTSVTCLLVNKDNFVADNLIVDQKTSSRKDYVLQHIFATPETDEKPIQPSPTPPIADTDTEPKKNFLDWYQDGVSSYLANDHSGCIENLEMAIKGYRDFYAATASCRIQCAGVARQVAPFYPDDIDDLHFYESAVRRTLCLIKCKRLLMPTLPEFFAMNTWSQDVFVKRTPYTYLQLCYYRVGYNQISVLRSI